MDGRSSYTSAHMHTNKHVHTCKTQNTSTIQVQMPYTGRKHAHTCINMSVYVCLDSMHTHTYIHILTMEYMNSKGSHKVRQISNTVNDLQKKKITKRSGGMSKFDGRISEFDMHVCEASKQTNEACVWTWVLIIHVCERGYLSYMCVNVGTYHTCVWTWVLIIHMCAREYLPYVHTCTWFM